MLAPSGEQCSWCDGRGWVTFRYGPSGDEKDMKDCLACDGTGQVVDEGEQS